MREAYGKIEKWYESRLRSNITLQKIEKLKIENVLKFCKRLKREQET